MATVTIRINEGALLQHHAKIIGLKKVRMSIEESIMRLLRENNFICGSTLKLVDHSTHYGGGGYLGAGRYYEIDISERRTTVEYVATISTLYWKNGYIVIMNATDKNLVRIAALFEPFESDD
jgi:hypothetical protein